MKRANQVEMDVLNSVNAILNELTDLRYLLDKD
jgi:hypothetical protein